MKNDAVAGVISDAFMTVCDDDAWRILGFKRRPRGGWLLQKLRRRWKVELENKALREMISLVVAAYVSADVLTADTVNTVAAQCTSTPKLVRAFGYESKDTAETDLCASLQAYINVPAERWPALLLHRLDPAQLPDKELTARLVVGCARFVANAQDFAQALARRIRETN